LHLLIITKQGKRLDENEEIEADEEDLFLLTKKIKHITSRRLINYERQMQKLVIR
jgi:hypothetical protein